MSHPSDRSLKHTKRSASEHSGQCQNATSKALERALASRSPGELSGGTPIAGQSVPKQQWPLSGTQSAERLSTQPSHLSK